MPTQRQRTKLFTEIVQVVCELMRANGVSQSQVHRELCRALTNAYSERDRKEVRDLPPISAMASITGRWHLEKAFVDKLGNPKPLTWNGKRGTLLSLAKRVVGNEKARATLELLVNRKLLVRTKNGSWLPRAHVIRPRGLDRPQVLRAAVMLQRLLRTISHNSAKSYRGDDLLFEVMTRVPRLPARDVAAFKTYARSQGMVYVRAVDDWLESRNLPMKGRGSRGAREAGVVVFAFEEPTSDA